MRNGKRSFRSTLSAFHSSSTLYRTALAGIVTAFAAGDAAALPSGAQVEAGGIDIQQPTATDLVVNQSTNRAIINWGNFDTLAGESTRFNQPGSNSVALNRINNGNATQILGNLSANGKLYIVNPAGVLFGAGAKVDVSGLIASTADINSANFMAGGMNFNKPGNPDASIINKGTITAAEGGLVALVAPGVQNDGVISAKMGTVQLASSQTVAIDMYGDGLYSFALGEKTTVAPKDENGNAMNSAVENNGSIAAQNVYLTANTAKDIVTNAVNNTGIVEATGAHMEGGTIVLDGGEGVTQVAGKLTAKGGAGQKGGKVTVTGAKVGVLGEIDASGATGGGEIRVGGDYQGGGTLAGSDYTYIGSDAVLRADATQEGNGGLVVVWSDIATAFKGFISSMGGALSGNGGLVEVSGKDHLDFKGQVDTSAANGLFGTLLLDPLNFVLRLGTNDSGSDGDTSNTAWLTASGNPANNGGAGGTVSEIYESEIENQNTNFILSAQNSFSVIGTSANGTVTLQPNRSLTIETRNNAGDGAGTINLTGSTHGSNLLFATSGTGNITINGSTDGTSASNITLSRLQTQNGTISVDTNNGNINVNNSVTATGTGGVTMNATGDILFGTNGANGGNATSGSNGADGADGSNGSITTASGAINLTAGSNVLLGANGGNGGNSNGSRDGGDGGNGGNGSLTSTTGAITVNAGNDIRVGGATSGSDGTNNSGSGDEGQGGSGGTGTITTASGLVSLLAGTNDATDDVWVDGDINLGTGNFLSRSRNFTIDDDGDTITTTGTSSKVTIIADSIDIDTSNAGTPAIDAADAAVTITRATAGTVGLGSAAGDTSITQAELDQIDSDEFTIGDPDFGADDIAGNTNLITGINVTNADFTDNGGSEQGADLLVRLFALNGNADITLSGNNIFPQVRVQAADQITINNNGSSNTITSEGGVVHLISSASSAGGQPGIRVLGDVNANGSLQVDAFEVDLDGNLTGTSVAGSAFEVNILGTGNGATFADALSIISNSVNSAFHGKINLAAGTYDSFNLNKNFVDVVGTGAVIIDPSSPGITISANGNTIDGLTTSGDSGDPAILLTGGANNTIIKNTNITNTTGNGAGIRVDNTVTSGLNLTVDNVTMTDGNINGHGIVFDNALNGSARVLIQDSDIHGGDSGSGNGIYFGGLISGNADIDILRNTISGGTDVGERRIHLSGGMSGDANVNIEGNNIFAQGDDGIQTESVGGNSRLTITGNQIALNSGFAGDNPDETGGGAAIDLQNISGTAAVSITGNSLEGHHVGIQVDGNVTTSSTAAGGYGLLIQDNTMQGLNRHVIEITGNIDGARVGINGNPLLNIAANAASFGLNGIHFGGSITDNAVVDILNNGGNGAGINAADHGIYFAGAINDGSTVNIHDNFIQANLDNDGTGSGIWFNGDINADVNIGDGNGSTIGNDPSNIIRVGGSSDGNDAIRFAGDVGQSADIRIDGNRLGYLFNLTAAGTGNDGVQFDGNIEGSAEIDIVDNWIASNDDGIEFENGVSDTARIFVGGAGDGNTINAEGNGIVFRDTITDESIILISSNTIGADEDGVRFEGDTSNADATVNRDDEILITLNDITAGDNGINFLGRASGDRHDIRIEGNTHIEADDEHGISHTGGIDGSQLWILDNTEIDGDEDGIHVLGAFFNDATILIDGNTDIDTNDGIGIQVVDTGVFPTGATLDITNNTVHDTGAMGIAVGFFDGANISNNTLTNNLIGIGIDDSDGVQLHGNTVDTGLVGALVVNSDNLDNNGNIYANNFIGMGLLNSNNASIVNDQFINNFIGFGAAFSDNLTLTNNIFTDNLVGIGLFDSDNARFEEQTIQTAAGGVGIALFGGSSDAIVRGLNISGGDIGVLIDGRGSSMQFEGDTSAFDGSVTMYFVLQNSAMIGETLDASQQTFDGTRAADFSITQLLDAEAKTIDDESTLLIGDVFYKFFPNLSGLDEFDRDRKNLFRKGLFSYAGKTLHNNIEENSFNFDVGRLDLSLLSRNLSPNTAGSIANLFASLAPAAGGPGTGKPVSGATDFASLSPSAGGAGGGTVELGNDFLGNGYKLEQ